VPDPTPPTAHIATPITPDLLRGALDVEYSDRGVLPHRLPAWARVQADEQLVTAQAQPSGVRLVFRTRATVVELDAHRTTVAFRDVAPRPDGRYDLLVDSDLAGQAVSTGGTAMIVDIATGKAETRDGPVGTVRFAGLPAREKDVEIWLPHHERIELVALRTDAPVEPVPAERRRPVWLHHGSSISQGSNAASPSTTWPALAAAHGGVELVNLGFGGSAMLDPFVARTMRDLPADLISVKIGINLVNGDVMRLRAFTPAVHGFLDTIRDGHPATPLLVVSPILCPAHEDTPGPGAPDFGDGAMRFRATGDPAEVAGGKLTLRVIRAELARIVARRAAEDPHLHLIDGRELYGEADAAQLPLPDRLHPDAGTHRLMGKRFAALAFGAGGPFAARLAPDPGGDLRP
jgi:hypothetical protein